MFGFIAAASLKEGIVLQPHQPFADSQYFNPVQDINGDWFIFEIEMNHAVKNKGWARATLSEFVPPIQEPLI